MLVCLVSLRGPLRPGRPCSPNQWPNPTRSCECWGCWCPSGGSWGRRGLVPLTLTRHSIESWIRGLLPVAKDVSWMDAWRSPVDAECGFLYPERGCFPSSPRANANQEGCFWCRHIGDSNNRSVVVIFIICHVHSMMIVPIVSIHA